MDPELFRHLGIFQFQDRCGILTCASTLEKTDALNLFFCFRYVSPPWNGHPINNQTLDFSWVLIAFKREFPFEDVLRLWEVLWTGYYTSEFVLFVALAVLESHRDMILRYLVEVGFDFTANIYTHYPNLSLVR
jgi:Rab-GTPase-TBC domain